MYDIMERRITLVEQLQKPRQPFPEMDVIYLVSSNIASIKRISADFDTPGKAKYANVHIFFLDGVSTHVITCSINTTYSLMHVR